MMDGEEHMAFSSGSSPKVTQRLRCEGRIQGLRDKSDVGEKVVLLFGQVQLLPKGRLKVVSAMFCWPLPFMFGASSRNYHERSAKPHNTHPLSVIGWNTIYCGFEWLVVPFVFVYDLGA